jgi:hypothetical protein
MWIYVPSYVIFFIIYAVAAASLDRLAHNMVYPIVGNGFPLVGKKRWLVRVFSPFVVFGLWCCMAPMVVLVIFAMAGYASRGGRGR